MKRFPIPIKNRWPDNLELENEQVLTISWSELDDDEISVIISAIMLERTVWLSRKLVPIQSVYLLVTEDWPKIFEEREAGVVSFVEITYLIEYWQYLLTIMPEPKEFILNNRKNLIQAMEL